MKKIIIVILMLLMVTPGETQSFYRKKKLKRIYPCKQFMLKKESGKVVSAKWN